MLAEMRRMHQFRYMPKALFYTYAHRALEHHLTRAVVKVAYPDTWEENGKTYSGNTRHIVGFIIADPTEIGLVIHYVYTRKDYEPNSATVKGSYRMQGVARALVEGMMRDYECKEAIYTLRGQDVSAELELKEKVDKQWSHWLTYNHMLFWTLLPHEWEKGIVATLDPKMRDSIRLQDEYAPVSHTKDLW